MEAGYRKVLKMTKSELFRLSSSNVGIKQVIDKKLLKDLKRDIAKIVKNFEGYLIHKCDIFDNFVGRDIDVLYRKKKNLNNINDYSIVRNINKNSFRTYLNHPKNKNFLSLDIEVISNMSEDIKKIFKQNFNKIIYCNHTGLMHLDEKSIIFYKIIKYFHQGTIHSFSQLFYLKNDIKKLNKDDLKFLLNSIEEFSLNEKKIIKKFIYWNFDKFEKNKTIKEFFYDKRSIRHNKRLIFSGRLNFKNVMFSKKFIYALVFGSNAKWTHTHNPMPAITIIGNDGSGKTTVVEHIRKKFSKMDPLIFDMKASAPFFSSTLKIRKILKNAKKNYIIKNINFIKTSISFFGELLDFTDKYFKYKIGMAWADAGYGLTIFERYPTDRVRGEFPNHKNRFLPLEQFFPFPDGMVYLDVLPKNSVARKKEDKHTLQEMQSKRKNYLSLLKEFNEVEILSASKNIIHKVLHIKNYIFKLNKKKKNYIKRKGKIERMVWKKNFKRVLADSNLDKSQKDAFFE